MKKFPFLYLIGGIFSLIIAMGIGRFGYTPLLPLMQHDLSFSDSVAGYLASSNYAGYFLGAILVGIFPFKNYRAFYLRLSIFISIITTFSMGLCNSYLPMLIIRFISGVASAVIFVLASSIVLDKLAANNKTNWSGWLYAGVGLGIFLSSVMIPSLHQYFDWKGGWIGLAIISLILYLFVWICLKDSQNINTKKNVQITATNTPPANWLLWLIIAYGMEGLGYIVTGTFIVSIAERTSFTNDPTIVWMVVGLCAIPSCILWSTAANKWGFVKSLVMAMLIQAIGIVLPVIWLSKMSLLVSATFFGATFMGITTLATTLARQMSPSNSSKTIGYLTTYYAVGQMIGPTIAGILLSITKSYNAALIGAAGVVFIGALLLLTGIRFDRTQNIETLTTK